MKSAAGGEKAEAYVAAGYLDEALAGFCGYIADDELYDGPFCVLSIVDNRAFKRLVYEVLDHDPTHEDILAFFQRFQEALKARRLAVKGITTDGLPLYPGPILEVYRLFDRRCRTETALGKLAALRTRVRRFKPVGKTLQKLFSPSIEKALTFLDDSLLPSTSNAVERGNRRHRKMHKSVCRVRTQEHIQGRIALDMQRDAQADGRTRTIGLLHHARACYMRN